MFFVAPAFGGRLAWARQELRQADAGHAGDAELQKAAAAESVAMARGASEIDAEHGMEPPGRVGKGDRGGQVGAGSPRRC